MVNFSKDDSLSILNIFKRNKMEYLDQYIVVSSFFVYKYYPLDRFRENKLSSQIKLPSSIDQYTKGKIEMELTLYNSKLFSKTTVLRLPFIFSFDDYTNRFQNLCKAAISQEYSKFNKKYKISLISKITAVKSIIKIIINKKFGFIDISNLGNLTSYELAKKISLLNFNIVEDFKQDNIKVEPYIVDRDLILKTNKIFVEETLEDQLIQEVNLFIKNSNFNK